VTIAAPLWLLLLPVALALAAVAERRRRAARAALRAESGDVDRARAGGSVEGTLALAGCAVLCVALARPDWSARDDGRREPPPCIFVLDGSRSMLAQDVAPNRFAAASARLLERARAEPGRRFGLVLFAGDAREVAPPTSDVDALAALLQELDPRRLADPGSDVGRGLERALARLAPPARGEIVVLSDGEWDGGESDAAAAHARELGVRVVAECFGGPTPAPIVLRDESGAPLASEPAALTTAAPARVAALASGPDAVVDSPADDADSRAAHRFRAWALAGLLLLAGAHWRAGRDA
jgi:Ca-activated chloride channel family protein